MTQALRNTNLRKMNWATIWEDATAQWHLRRSYVPALHNRACQPSAGLQKAGEKGWAASWYPTSSPVQICSADWRCTSGDWSPEPPSMIWKGGRGQTASSSLQKIQVTSYSLGVQLREVSSSNVTILRKRVDFSDGDHVSQHVTQPLRIQEVEVLQGGIVVVQQDSVLVQEGCRLVELGSVSERHAEPVQHFLRHVRSVVLRRQHGILSLREQKVTTNHLSIQVPEVQSLYYEQEDEIFRNQYWGDLGVNR